MKKRTHRLTYARGIDIAVFVLPAMIVFAVFVLYPIIPELIISFQDNDGFSVKGWVGWDNYNAIFTSPNFRLAHKNTYITVAVAILGGFPISLLLALLMDVTSPRTRNFFKFASVFPAVLSPTVIGRLWVAIYENDWGVINSLLRAVGLGSWTHAWLGEPKFVMACVAVVFVWQVIGLDALLLYAGIKAIPKTYYEAAQLDGGGFWVNSIHITIPLLQDMIKYVILTLTLGALGMFSYVNVMTLGGPGYSSRTVTYEMYQLAFARSEFGQGCAVAVVFMLECITIALIINRYIAREKIEY